MPIQMERLESFLVEERLKYRLHKHGHLVTGFSTRNYVAADGTRGIAIAVRLTENGGYLECIAPAVYDTSGCPHVDALLQLLPAIVQRSKMIRFEHDPDGGEVRCSVECPIEDGTVTRRQFLRMLKAIPELIDDWDRAIRLAMTTGTVLLPASAAATPNDGSA